MNLNKVKDTIRKLLNLAENDAATEGEVRNALNFAQKLMDQHQLTEEDLPDADNRLLEIERAECAQMDAYTGNDKVAMWERTLAHFVSQFTHVKHYLQSGTEVVRKNGIAQLNDSGRPRRARRFVFYGLVEDAQFATQLYEELRVTLASIARLKYGSVYRGSGRDYCEGFANGLYTQVQEVQRPKLSNSTALVVKRNEIVEAKQRRAVDFIREQGVRLVNTRVRSGARSRDFGARESGYRDGKSYRVGERQRRLT